eukprot:gene18507-20366_t
MATYKHARLTHRYKFVQESEMLQLQHAMTMIKVTSKTRARRCESCKSAFKEKGVIKQRYMMGNYGPRPFFKKATKTWHDGTRNYYYCVKKECLKTIKNDIIGSVIDVSLVKSDLLASESAKFENEFLHISNDFGDLNHFATNRPSNILKADVLKIGMVDHYLIFAIRKLNAKRLLNKQAKLVETCNLRNYDKQLFLEELSAIDWNDTLDPTNGDPDLMASVFNSVVSSVLDMHAPLRRRKVTNHHAPWITAEIKNTMKERDLAKKRSEKDASYWSDYKKLRNKVTSEIRTRVQEYYHNLIDETQNDPKAMWKTINKVLHKNSNQTVTQSIIFEGTELKAPLQISEAFNKHFTPVGPKLAEKITSQPTDDPLKYLGSKATGTKFTLQPVSVGGVQPLFDQSATWGPVRVTLCSNITVPERTECIIPCKLPPSCSNQLGMISPKVEPSNYLVACTVSQATNRKIAVTVMNTSSEPLQLYADQNVAEFSPVSELVPSPSNTDTFPSICTTVEESGFTKQT